MTQEVLIAIIGFAGITVTGMFGYLSTRNKQKQIVQMSNEMTCQQNSLSFSDFLQVWPEVHQDLQSLMATTNIDRFLILKAWNGELQPKWTTAIFQVVNGDQGPINYVHFGLDNDYVERLRAARFGDMKYVVDDMPDSEIKRVYQSEKITEAIWAHIDREVLHESNSVGVTYCSYATHSEEGIDDDTMMKCKLISNRLRSLSLEG